MEKRNAGVFKKDLEDVERSLIFALKPRNNTNKKNTHGPIKILVVENYGKKPAKLPYRIVYAKSKQISPPTITNGTRTQKASSLKRFCSCNGCFGCKYGGSICGREVRAYKKRLCHKCRKERRR